MHNFTPSKKIPSEVSISILNSLLLPLIKIAVIRKPYKSHIDRLKDMYRERLGIKIALKY